MSGPGGTVIDGPARYGRAVPIGVGVGVSSIVLGVYPIVVLVVAGLVDWLIDDYVLHASIPAIGLGVIGLVAIRHQPSNRAVWVVLSGGALAGLASFGWATAPVLGLSAGLDMSIDAFYALAPADLPWNVALAFSMVSFGVMAIFLLLTLGLILFPNGDLPSPRWRWFARVSASLSVLAGIPTFVIFYPSSTVSYGASSSEWTGLGAILQPFLLVAMAFAAISLGSVVVRYRSSVGELRQQYRWIGLGCLVLLVSLVIVVLGPGPVVDSLNRVDWFAVLVGIASVIFCYGVAILKYRLYDVDVVISRTMVYGALALFITAVYVGVVVGLGLVFSAGDEVNVWLGIGATVIVALAFQPLRRALQRLANRLVYGRRATPYEVLSSLSQQVAVVDRDVLVQVARSLTEGTTATGVSIWSVPGEGPRLLAAWPQQPDSHLRESSSESDRVARIVHDGELLGEIRLQVPPGQPFTPTDEDLLDQVASGLGLALRNLLLTDDLRARVDLLRESRRRVVALQDQTRQLLERDLHDGAQQRLVALKIKVGIAASLAAKEILEDVRAILDTVRGETDLTIESLRDLARGIYPPLLEAEGLEAALTAQLRRAPLPVTVQAAGIRRYPREVEATVYFCVLEAVQNAVKHARAKSVLVAILDDEGMLGFEVRDDGIGFDVGLPAEGSDLQNMTDRLDALNGTLHISASANHGTKVVGSIPLMEVTAP